MKVLTIVGLFLMMLIASCSHAGRGSVAMKVNDREAHVVLGKNEVKVGDRIIAFYNDCQNKDMGTGRMYGTPCVKTKLGGGIITQVLNDHYSVVEFDEGVKFTEGTFVEKQ